MPAAATGLRWTRRVGRPTAGRRRGTDAGDGDDNQGDGQSAKPVRSGRVAEHLAQVQGQEEGLPDHTAVLSTAEGVGDADAAAGRA
jgi:hypothetical protein